MLLKHFEMGVEKVISLSTDKASFQELIWRNKAYSR